MKEWEHQLPICRNGSIVEKKEGARWMIVVCDTFDHEDYPCFVSTEKEFKEKYEHYDGKNMQRIMEIYDLKLPFNQENKPGPFAHSAGRAWNPPVTD